MNDYASLRKKNNGTLFVVVALTLCVALTAAMLFSRLVGFVSQDHQQEIPLTVSSGITHVTAIQKPQQEQLAAGICKLSAVTYVSEVQPETQAPTSGQSANPGFQVRDEDTVWLGQTDVEIFRVSYENGEGNVTVNSQSGDKLLAPGTENEYNFTLVNTGDVNLNYTLQMEAYFSDGEKAIPVVARLVDCNGTYLVGSADSYADVLELNSVNRQESITAGYVMPYTLQWQWPFEGDDEYDTWLGDLAAEEDITLTIVIRTTAEYGGEDAEGGTPPKTGDTSAVALMVGVMAVCACGIVVLLILPRRKTEEQHDQR